MSKRREQVSVPLDAQQREFVEEQAARQDRSLAGQIRHWVAAAMRQESEAGGRAMGAGDAKSISIFPGGPIARS